MKYAILFPVFLYFTHVYSQNFVDTVYSINTISNVEYGQSTNFAGEQVSLYMDISYPTNDVVPSCGRPLAIIIHGGAWIAGSKNEGYIPGMRTDFAKRGYVAVAINYRLGVFQTEIAKNCNVAGWNCMNLADSAEWSRALYRGIQDAKGALRFMINNQTTYQIDASNVYVIGESAGAFIALGVGYMDDASEKPIDCGAIDPVLAPHQNYYAPCIQGTAFDIPIQDMDLSRPDLGSIEGALNPTSQPYIIKGVGSIYGAIYKDLFSTKTYSTTPKLYMFHQPNDLIVPIGYNRLLNGFNACAMNTGCVNIQNRKFTYGSGGINNMIDTLNIPANHKPEVKYEPTNNNADCIQQVLNPSVGGHQLDSYWNRTTSMANFFAESIGTNDCATLSTLNEDLDFTIMFPNPVSDILNIRLNSNSEIILYDMQGKIIKQIYTSKSIENIDVRELKNGIYLLKITSNKQNTVYKVVKN